jgi:hypothetical protein
MQELHSGPESSPDWDSVSPFLDEAISTLDDQDRDALLLRFFKNQDFRAVGTALGVSDNAAQKRVARTLEKLRDALRRRGVTTTTSALAAGLVSNAVQAAPANLVAGWINASLAGATTGGGATLTLLKFMSMTKFQLGLGVIVVGALTATVATQYQTENKMRGENQGLRLQLASLAADNESLSNGIAVATMARPLAADQLRELVRLRGEVGMLRQKTNSVTALQQENRQLQESVQSAKSEAEEAAHFAEHRQNIINAAKEIGTAFRIWANDNGDQYPTNFAEIHNELANTTNFTGNIPLDSFEMVNVGKANETYPQAAEVRERAPRRSPLGGWERVYLMCDGSVQMAYSPDGNFDAWEQSHYANSFPTPSQ